jgi:hypothetical protein
MFNRRKLKCPCGHLLRHWWAFWLVDVGYIFECPICGSTWEYQQ